MIKRYKKRQETKQFYRTNERIFAQTLRVLDTDGKQIGILSKFEALSKAKESGLDLVEVAPTAKPPVARIIDFKKFLYQESKKKRDEKKKSKVSETKEVRLGPFMNEHDLDVMVRRAREFLSDNDKVRFVMKFMGRQIVHPEFGQATLKKVLESLSDVSKIEREAHFEGKQLITIVSPEKKKIATKAVTTEDNKEGKAYAKEENKKVSQ
ncbi:MAG: translation initiation factor IF-3 [Candidatus Levybacteria bacterium]|nr:translation initiation factor IF-3 [Candidatus Levybacteria bacterium]